MNKLFLTIGYLSVVFFFAFCSKKNKEACTLNCLNGGSCVDNSCNCSPNWSGPNCDTYFTKKIEGEYSSTDYACANTPQGLKVFDVKVDSTDKNRLWIGNLHVTMINLTDFRDSLALTGVFDVPNAYTGSFDKEYHTFYLQKMYYDGRNTSFCKGKFTRN